jgi:hypothetical protein
MEITKRLLELTQEHSGIDVTVKRRHRDLVEVRALYCHVFKEIQPSKTLKFIGDTVGLNHATVIHALKQYYFYEKYNPHLKFIKTIIISKIKSETTLDYYINEVTLDVKKILLNNRENKEGYLFMRKIKLLIEEYNKPEEWYEEALEQRMNIIGQNGNDGEHYN